MRSTWFTCGIQYNAIQCTVQYISQMSSAVSSQHLDAVIDFTFINLSIHLFQHFLEEILLGKKGKQNFTLVIT